MQNNLTPSNNLPALPSEKVRSGIRLAASDPACLSPAIARVDTGPCPDGDPRRVAAREEHDRYLRLAPSFDDLDELERRAASGTIRAVRQESPGVYSFAVGTRNTIGVWGGPGYPRPAGLSRAPQ